MHKQMGVKYDSPIFTAFVSVVSIYPPGTILLMDGNRLALVTGKNPDDMFRPKAKLIGKDGRLLEKSERIDLSRRDPHTGDYVYTIVATANPAEIGVQTNKYILESD
jgi:hypothetical protein